MSDRLYPPDLRVLLDWILSEESTGQIFGIHRSLFFQPGAGDRFRIRRYGQLLETPVGVAAGPHTQLAAGILASWLCGARYLELKTVQTLDSIRVTKPCIDMQDEGYNCEWSQELSLEESFREYARAWILIHILRDRFGWGFAEGPGCIFNLSVGYDLAGIREANVQKFLDRMTGCGDELAGLLSELYARYPELRDLPVPAQISNSVTLSTMHGCPPAEIEKIALYLIRERRLHTTIKLNPTLLGPERLRAILHRNLGYQVQVPEEAFEHDLNYGEALDLIRILRGAAAESGVEFGLKLTNTLEVLNTRSVLPESERTTYLSGRALHPISINLAARLQQEFAGELDLSFSAGVDCYNLPEVLACGIQPVTVCSDLLKPGGVTRLGQYLEELDRALDDSGAGDLEEFIRRRHGTEAPVRTAGLSNLRAYSRKVLEDSRYHKAWFPYTNIKTGRSLTHFDCVSAPCLNTCAISQDIPGYLFHTAAGDFERAREIVDATNPFPGVTGMACDHLCQSKCTRINYDQPLLVREIKRFLAEGKPAGPVVPVKTRGPRVAIIGAGPSGLACAWQLRRSGVAVEIFESGDRPGGLVSGVIPAFRLSETAFQRDLQAILELGIKLHLQAEITADRFDRLRREYDFVYIAVGARRNKQLGIPGEDLPGVLDPLDFLSRVRRNIAVTVGRRVLVVGGGNSAMDAARTALRLAGDQGRVVVAYRRTRREMPVNHREVEALLKEGAGLLELVVPVSITRRKDQELCVTLQRLSLGKLDASGRPRPVPVPGSQFDLPCDTVIPAIGQEVQVDFCPEQRLQADPDTGLTAWDNVYAGGDAVRGADTLIHAIADGKRAARSILRQVGVGQEFPAGGAPKISDPAEAQRRLSRREPGVLLPHRSPVRPLGFEPVILTLDETSARREAGRCLYCDEFCNICVTVCPNRANVAYACEPADYPVFLVRRHEQGFRARETGRFRVQQAGQILNLAELCNQCGNCTTFCPTRGAPYLDKPRFYLSRENFEQEQNGYFLAPGTLACKTDNRVETVRAAVGNYSYASELVRVEFHPDDLHLLACKWLDPSAGEVMLEQAVKMIVMLKNLESLPCFQPVSAGAGRT